MAEVAEYDWHNLDVAGELACWLYNSPTRSEFVTGVEIQEAGDWDYNDSTG